MCIRDRLKDKLYWKLGDGLCGQSQDQFRNQLDIKIWFQLDEELTNQLYWKLRIHFMKEFER